MKTVKLGDILNERDLLLAAKLRDAKEICKQIITPQLAVINERLGQENDPMYLAYAVVYALERYASIPSR